MDITKMIDTAKAVRLALGLKVMGAIAIHIVGRWLIGIAAGYPAAKAHHCVRQRAA